MGWAGLSRRARERGGDGQNLGLCIKIILSLAGTIYFRIKQKSSYSTKNKTCCFNIRVLPVILDDDIMKNNEAAK